ncbi:amidohydrolase family protein [Nonomuraea angiospora]|uniref:Cytosine/adenosine deaminase-related metal-dependent hydrolase n=1 Tax=Nonomuraea angiospora TaxID=46172 RepID=A0ABR9M075_9ACTN|nr:amidohydrolase family protein [Nonomuraea angiospora]MBE1585987.1 cytosine/adenosine deaminase-related metal-dependent hydrolase [Nonomuraea angiospora]
MPSAKRAGPVLNRRAPTPVVVHSAPIVLPVCADPIRDGAVATKGDRVVEVGTRASVTTSFPAAEELRWTGMIVAGLVDARSAAPAAGPGVTARAGVVSDLAELAGVPGISYVEVTSASEEEWETRGRDAVITTIREVDRPCAVGIAAHTPDPQVLEDVAVLARTFGLRLLVDLDRHSPAALDEAGVLGRLCHVAVSRPLDPGERKLLRLRKTVVAVCASPAPDVLALLDEGNPVALGTGAGGGPAGVLGVARGIRQHARELGLRTRGLDGRLVVAATMGGARALGMDRGKGRIGSLAPGARADFAVFDARGRYPYAALLAQPPCLGTVIGGTVLPAA